MDHLIASDIMISNGSVRFLSVSWLRRCEYGSPSAKEAHSRQWQQLERLFDGFIRDTKMYACVATRLLAQQARIIPRLPRPQRPLTPPPIFPRTPSDLMVYLVLYTPECFDDWLRTSGNTLPSKSHRNKGSKYWRRSNIGCLISPSSPPPDKFHGSCEEVVDKPLIDRHLLSSRIPHSRAEARTASYPYGNGVQKKLLLRCDDTD
jgi:hypothetical protein